MTRMDCLGRAGNNPHRDAQDQFRKQDLEALAITPKRQNWGRVLHLRRLRRRKSRKAVRGMDLAIRRLRVATQARWSINWTKMRNSGRARFWRISHTPSRAPISIVRYELCRTNMKTAIQPSRYMTPAVMQTIRSDIRRLCLSQRNKLASTPRISRGHLTTFSTRSNIERADRDSASSCSRSSKAGREVSTLRMIRVNRTDWKTIRNRGSRSCMTSACHLSGKLAVISWDSQQ